MCLLNQTSLLATTFIISLVVFSGNSSGQEGAHFVRPQYTEYVAVDMPSLQPPPRYQPVSALPLEPMGTSVAPAVAPQAPTPQAPTPQLQAPNPAAALPSISEFRAPVSNRYSGF